ncbi:hypothetical protein SROCM77S_06069 [Streptomyces rochei]
MRRGAVSRQRRRTEPAIVRLVRQGILRVSDFFPGQRQDIGQPSLLEAERNGVQTP